MIQNSISTYAKKSRAASAPALFDLGKAPDRATLEECFASGAVQHVHDFYRAQMRELFAIEHPSRALAPGFNDAFDAWYEKLTRAAPEWQLGTWAYFPWISTLVHILPHDDFQRVRLSRNRTLISDDEQKRFYESTIAIAGLSIGNSVALAIALEGGARRMKLADFDSLDLSNLNRIRAGVESLGVPKVEIAARQVYLINPYAQIELFGAGLTTENIDAFLAGVQVVIDEFDNFAIKRLIRERARAARIPLISGADVGESAVIGIERYDTSPNTIPFHGRVADMNFEQMKQLDKRAIGAMIAQLVGLENHNTRMLEWPKYLGKKDGIVSFPQRGGMALLNGSLVAYCAFAFAVGLPIKNGRATLSLEKLFLDDSYFSPKMRAEYEAAVATFKKML